MADAPYTIDVVIEAPGGDTNRYAYDAEAHIFKLVEVIYTHAPLPAELGAIVGTLTEAATPLGAMVIAGVPIIAGAIVTARPIGGVEMGGQDNRATYVVVVPTVDRAQEDIQDIRDLPSERKSSLERFCQTYGATDGTKHTIRWLGTSEIRRTLETARRMGRMARVGERDRGATSRAWQALVEWSSAGTEGEATHYTVAELSLSKLPYRFQTYVGQMLMPDERILFFVERPSVQMSPRLFGRGKSLPEGLLVVTTRQILWMYDSLPPTATLVGYGYIAKTFVLARLAHVELREEGDLVHLRLAVADTSSRQEESVIVFPRRLTPDLRRVMDYLKGFTLAADKAQLLCLAELEPTEEKLEDVVEKGDEKTMAKLPVLTTRMQEVLAEGEFVVEQALVPAWMTEKGDSTLVAVTDRRLLVLSSTRHSEADCESFPFGTISSVELSHSVLECWLRILLPTTKNVDHIQVNLPLVALGRFTRVFLALRRGLTAATAFALGSARQ